MPCKTSLSAFGRVSSPPQYTDVLRARLSIRYPTAHDINIRATADIVTATSKNSKNAVHIQMNRIIEVQFSPFLLQKVIHEIINAAGNESQSVHLKCYCWKKLKYSRLSKMLKQLSTLLTCNDILLTNNNEVKNKQ